MNAPTLAEQAAHLTALSEALALMASEMASADGAHAHFTCGEVDSLANVLALAGHHGEAVEVLVDHALWESAEDHGDEHATVRFANPDDDEDDTLNDMRTGRARAVEYLAARFGRAVGTAR